MKITTEKPLEICKDHLLLKVHLPGINPCPGQFINIKTGSNTDPLLRRPFSVHNYDSGTLEIVFRVVGKGTEILKNLAGTDEIDIIGPAGNGFTLTENGRVLILGGGVGNAPLFYLAKLLKDRKNHITYIYGAKSKDLVFLEDKFKSVSDEFIISTDDGSLGLKGRLTDHAGVLIKQNDFDFIYSCGPDIMQKKAVELLKEKDTPIETSIEKYFGCGIGLCYGCTALTTEGMKRVCREGPVFNGRLIVW